MPFLKNIIIDDKTKIKIWKVILGELNPKELIDDENKLFILKKKKLKKF